jgi:hypothetical protein
MPTGLLSMRYANIPNIVYFEKQDTEKIYGGGSYLKLGLISSYRALIWLFRLVMTQTDSSRNNVYDS